MCRDALHSVIHYWCVYCCFPQVIENLDRLKRLHTLNLAHNVIEKLEHLDVLVRLKDLDVSHNRLTKIEGKHNRDHWVSITKIEGKRNIDRWVSITKIEDKHKRDHWVSILILYTLSVHSLTERLFCNCMATSFYVYLQATVYLYPYIWMMSDIAESYNISCQPG